MPSTNGGAVRTVPPDADGEETTVGAQQRKLSRRSEASLPQHAAGELRF